MDENASTHEAPSNTHEDKQANKDRVSFTAKLALCLSLCNTVTVIIILCFVVLQTQMTAIQNQITSGANITTIQTGTIMDIFNESTEMSSPNYRVAPLIVFLYNFIVKLDRKEHWKSKPFFCL